MVVKTIIGQTARGERYFPRTSITDEIWRKFEGGNNILLVAPRRVGKSSILFHLFDNPQEHFLVIYYISESVNSENEFYKKLLHHILEKISGVTKYKVLFKKWTKEFSTYIESIGPKGVKFRQGSSVIYYEELKNFLKQMNLGEEKIVILIDEFATTVENILQDEGERAAIHFLESKRALRQEPDIQGKLCFIYSGSIGLENIVNRINSINLVNDLMSIPVPPLSKTEVKMLVDKILVGSEISFQKGALDHMIARIEWCIPYYFQITIDESSKILLEQKACIISNEVIESAIKNALKQRAYFEHWFTRLRKAYQGNNFSFVKELLNQISEKKIILKSEVFDLAVKYDLNDSYHDLVNALKYDGYINNNDDPKTYRFNSYLLREWWNANIAN